MMDKSYIEIVRLLLESAPAIFETPHFAMKGGTALNLFIENMPRLSVDIDVVFTDHQATRDQALQAISNGLDATRKRLAKTGLESEVSATKDGDEIKPAQKSNLSMLSLLKMNGVPSRILSPSILNSPSDPALMFLSPVFSVPLASALAA